MTQQTQAFKARKAETDRIRSENLEPERCPICTMMTLWPDPEKAMNSVSRRDNATYICNLCGTEEALADHFGSQ
jgi:hypothetical protein